MFYCRNILEEGLKQKLLKCIYISIFLYHNVENETKHVLKLFYILYKVIFAG